MDQPVVNLHISTCSRHHHCLPILFCYFHWIITFMAFMQVRWSSFIWGTVLTLVERCVENGRLWGSWIVIWIRGLPNSWNRNVTFEESWLCFQQSAVILFSPQHLDWLWVPPSLLVNGCRWLVFRDKAARVRSWDFTFVANLKNVFNYTFTLPRVLMAWWLFERKWSFVLFEGWNFNSGNYLFTTDTK